MELVTKHDAHSHVRDLVYIALGAVMITIGSWITVPSVVPFTLQTLFVFLTVLLLGGKRGCVSVVIYILLGAAGVPVFSGFRGGIGHLLGLTGGYIVGFVLSALFMWLMEGFTKGKRWRKALVMVLALLILYAFGTGWFYVVYQKTTGPVGLMSVLGWCVFPFIIPDLIKIAIALFLNETLRKIGKTSRLFK